MFTSSERQQGWRFSLVEAGFQGIVGALNSSTSPFLVPFALSALRDLVEPAVRGRPCSFSSPAWAAAAAGSG